MHIETTTKQERCHDAGRHSKKTRTHVVVATPFQRAISRSRDLTGPLGITPGDRTLTFCVTLGRQVRCVVRVTARRSHIMIVCFRQSMSALSNLGDCRRVVLFNLIRGNDDSDTTTMPTKKNDDDDDDREDIEVEVRHHAIRTKPIGVDRRVRRIIESSPNLLMIMTTAAMATYFGGGKMMSDSEAEDESNQVGLLPTVNKKMRQKNNSEGGTTNTTASSSSSSNNKSALKLV